MPAAVSVSIIFVLLRYHRNARGGKVNLYVSLSLTSKMSKIVMRKPSSPLVAVFKRWWSISILKVRLRRRRPP